MPFDVELHERARQIGKGLIGALENRTNTRRPDNRVTFVIFHARRREQIRHAARYLHSSMTRVLSSSFLSLSLFASAQLNFSSCPWKEDDTHTHVYDSIFLINARFFPRLESLVFVLSLSLEFIHPREKEERSWTLWILDSFHVPCRDFHFNGDQVSAYGSKYDTFLLSTACHTLMVINRVNRCS